MSCEPDESGSHFDHGVTDALGNELEEDGKVQTDKIALKREVKMLMEHLGGFEFWPDLIDDCKEHVVKFLDYETLTKLGMCSKSDNALTRKIPVYVYGISIQENESHHSQWANRLFRKRRKVCVEVQFNRNFSSGIRFEMIFSQLGKGRDAERNQILPSIQPEESCLVIKNSNYYEEAVKYAEYWMGRCQFKLNEITVEMTKYPMETSKIKFLPNCTRVKIGADTVETFRWWIDKVPKQLEIVEFLNLNKNRGTLTLPSEFLNLPQIMEAKNIHLWLRAAFTDEQFLKLKAETIIFEAVNITDDSINEFLKKWANGKGIDDFKVVLLYSTRAVDQQRMMRGLQVRPWDAAFKEEAVGFCDFFARCCGSGERFQISSIVEPFDSLTLSFHDDRLSIHATGKKKTLGETTYTDYSIP